MKIVALKGNSSLLICLKNGAVERKNMTIMGLVISMLQEKILPVGIWGEVVNVYMLTGSSTKILPRETPYEKWSG